MIYVYLQHHRGDFFKYMQNNLFDYKELFDLSVVDMKDGDYVLTDTVDIPAALHTSSITYKCDALSGKSIESFDELSKFIGVLHVGTPSCVIPERTLRVVVDDLFYYQLSRTPDPVFQGINLMQQSEDIVIRPPEVVEVVAPRVTTLSDKPQQDLGYVNYSELTFPETPIAQAPVPVVMQQQPIAPRKANIVPQTFVPDQQFEQEALAVPQYGGLSEIQNRPMSVTRGSIRDAIQLRRHSGVNPNMTNILFGITPDCGTSTLSYMLTLRMAELFPDKQICLVDMDVVKPDLTGMLMRISGLDSRTDANLMNLAQLGVDDWLDNQQFLTTEITVGEARFSFIGHTTTGFADKRRLASYDYTQKLDMLRDSYDCVIVDGGRIQATADYQLVLLPSMHKKLIVADGTSRSTLLAFLRDVSSINVDYNIAVNKLSRNLSPVAIERQLAREVCAALPIKNSIEPFILNGNSVASIEDPVYLRNLQQIIEGVIL